MTTAERQAQIETARYRSKAFAEELERLCIKHGVRVMNDGAAGMWINTMPDDDEGGPGSEYCP